MGLFVPERDPSRRYGRARRVAPLQWGVPELPTPEELEASLWRDLLDRWFPACIDPEGGYRQNFDAAFRPTGDATKGLVFQSRMVWVCATVAEQRPEFAEWARHGVRFLKDRMDGGLTWAVDRDGRPPTDERHAYGIAFAIYGLAAAARHLGDEDALAMAKRLYGYLQEAHDDREEGGWFEASGPDGKARLEGEGADAIGTPYGQKSQNTHLHLMEAFTELVRAWPDPSAVSDLRTAIQTIASDFRGESGHLALFVHRDWKPASTDVSYGHDIEAAHLLLDAASVYAPFSVDEEGYDDAPHFERAVRALGERTLGEGWDAKEGGVFNLGNASGPTDRRKVWWVQAEALLGFAALWRHAGEVRYADALAKTWAFVRERQVDPVYGGWFEEAGRPEMPKGHAWKAAYHDGRALLFTARLLRGA